MGTLLRRALRYSLTKSNRRTNAVHPRYCHSPSFHVPWWSTCRCSLVPVFASIFPHQRRTVAVIVHVLACTCVESLVGSSLVNMIPGYASSEYAYILLSMHKV